MLKRGYAEFSNIMVFVEIGMRPFKNDVTAKIAIFELPSPLPPFLAILF